MYTRTSRWLSISLLVCGVGLPAAVHAEQLVAFVKIGSITITAGVARPVVTLADGALNVRAVFDDGAFEAEQCRPCVAGTVMGVGGRIIATGKGNQFYEVDFSLTGTPLEVPRSGYADLVLTSPFTLQGRMIVAPRREAGASEKEPAIALEGGGTVTIKLTSSIDPDTGERLYFFQDATYQFSPSAQ
jgi:hypothetical protein